NLISTYRRRGATKPPRTSDLVVLGRLEIERGNRTAGIDILNRISESNKDPRLTRQLAKKLDETGDRRGAIRAYQKARLTVQGAALRDVDVRLGALLIADGKTQEARVAWEEAKRLAPNDQSLRRQLADSLASHGQWRAALAELQEIEGALSAEPTV